MKGKIYLKFIYLIIVINIIRNLW